MAILKDLRQLQCLINNKELDQAMDRIQSFNDELHLELSQLDSFIDNYSIPSFLSQKIHSNPEDWLSIQNSLITIDTDNARWFRVEANELHLIRQRDVQHLFLNLIDCLGLI